MMKIRLILKDNTVVYGRFLEQDYTHNFFNLLTQVFIDTT